MTYRSVDIDAPLTHPSPDRPVSRAMLAFGIVAAPAAWAVQLIASYLFATGACYPKDVPLSAPQGAAVWWIMMAISLVAPIFAGVTLVLAAGSFRRAERHRDASATTMENEQGLGRTRFLALCGLLTSGGFLIVILLTTAAFFLLPLC